MSIRCQEPVGFSRRQYILKQHLIHGIDSLIAKIHWFMNHSMKKMHTFHLYSHMRKAFVSFPFTLSSSGLEVLHTVVRTILPKDIINISLNCKFRLCPSYFRFFDALELKCLEINNSVSRGDWDRLYNGEIELMPHNRDRKISLESKKSLQASLAYSPVIKINVKQKLPKPGRMT